MTANMISRLRHGVLDLLFPPRCVGCQREGGLLCEICETELPRLMPPYCNICAQPSPDQVCARCAVSPLNIDGVRAPYLMEGAVREAVHSLKYRNLRAVAALLGRLLAAYLESYPLPGEVLVPVPLHPRRLRERGYNQVALLAKELGRRTGLPVAEDMLVRRRDTRPQVSVANREERVRNAEESFACGADVREVAVLLIDDVATTGSTLSACAAALKGSGAKSVWGLTLAREA
jgi:ComF family protein